MSDYEHLFKERQRCCLPGVPTSEVATLEGLRNALDALIQRSYTMGRDKGDVRSSSVTVQDLLNLRFVTQDGRTLESRVADIERRLDEAAIP